jgi:hypothetical protein
VDADDGFALALVAHEAADVADVEPPAGGAMSLDNVPTRHDQASLPAGSAQAAAAASAAGLDAATLEHAAADRTVGRAACVNGLVRARK